MKYLSFQLSTQTSRKLTILYSFLPIAMGVIVISPLLWTLTWLLLRDVVCVERDECNDLSGAVSNRASVEVDGAA